MTEPFDPTPDEDALLAVSALLDGTASAEETARVESDPALRALLDDLRALRTEVADVAPPPAATREAAIAGALAVFDDLHAPAATAAARAASPAARAAAPATGNVVRFERRRRWYGVVTGAAAAVVAVLFVGALVSGGLGGSDEESTAFESAPADARSTPAETFSGAAEAAPAMGAEPMTAPGEMSATEMDAATAATDAAGQTGGAAGDIEMADTTEAPSAEEPDATNAATDDTIDRIDVAAEVVAITSPEQLRDYARGRRAVLPLPGLGFPCVEEGLEAIGEVTYQGVQAIVVRDPSTGSVTAYDVRGSCAVVASVEP